MRGTARVFGPLLIVTALAACGASSAQRAVMSSPPARTECWKGGTECRWDNQCCSGRCYVDTGCSG
jgi:hypothetical protein